MPNLIICLAEPIRLFVHDRVGDRDDAIASERFLSSDHLVKDYSHAKKIASGVNVLADDLLGGHVAGGAEHLPIHGQIGLEG